MAAILSTSGRIHGEFLHLLRILSHRQTVQFFDAFGKEPFSDTFIFCRAVYFIHNRAKRSGRAQVTSIRVLVSLSRVFHSVKPIRNLVEPLQCTEGHLMKLSPALTPCITLFVLLS